ncbi:MAG TPA: DUF5655 domain-containing protein [Candidatus Angelobacter sp.]|nr:DUF5655 domain-containing protein [Candidatus Angelobacter sp.]
MRAATRKSASGYDVHPGVAMVHRIMAGMKQKTGRGVEEWLDLIERQAPAGEKERRAWLKEKHGLGMNYASWLAERSVGKGQDGSAETYLKQAEEYVAKMFSGPKAGLRPIYGALVKLGRSMGEDVKVCPGQTIVPFYRKHVFAQVKPATQNRIDLGLALKDIRVPKRLIDTGGLKKKDRITRRIEIVSLADIDDEVNRWLKKAYEMDA